MESIFDLVEALEGYNKCKVNFRIDEEYFNCDLGIIDENEIFIPCYTSAVVHRNNIDATNEQLENILAN